MTEDKPKRSPEELDRIQHYFRELTEAADSEPPEERKNKFLEKLREAEQQRKA